MRNRCPSRKCLNLRTAHTTPRHSRSVLEFGVVLLCSSESLAPISDRMKQFARFLVEECTTNLVGACVNVDDEHPVGVW